MGLLTWKGGTLEAPLPPVLVSCGTLDSPNVLTVAWTGIVNTDPPMNYISVRPERFSFEILRKICHQSAYGIVGACHRLLRCAQRTGYR